MKESDMRKMFWQINMTLDGFMEGRGHELDDTAQFADPEFDRYASAMLQSIDQIVLGRVTYELFAGYWPTATGPDAERLNDLPKLVFSRTLGEVAWSNARLARGDVAEEITRLKRQRGGDIALFGSATLAATLAEQALIDEYRVLVSPVVLGAGNAAFRGMPRRLPLRLVKSEAWSSGVVALFYAPVRMTVG
jgi:dihydrofolate reductase